MRFLLASLFLHLFIVSLVFISFESHMKDRVNPRAVPIELISPGKSSLTKNLMRKAKQKSKTVTKSVQKKKSGDQPSPSKFKLKEVLSSENNVDQIKSQKQQESAALTYVQELKLFVEKNKQYPRQALRLKQAGVVTVKLKIETNGAFANIRLSEPSPYPILNQAAVKLLKKLKGFRPLPENLKNAGSDFIIPVDYVL